MLNTRPEQAAGDMLRPFLRQVTFGGAQGRDPLGTPGGLTAGFIAPALTRLAALGVTPAWRQPLRGLEIAAGRVAALHFETRRVALAATDSVVLALPPRATARLVPGVRALPDSGILVAHFCLPEARPRQFSTLLAEEPIWLLVEGRIATATVGAACALMPTPGRVLAARLWRSVGRALDLPAAVPPVRVLKYRGGTYLHSPAAERSKPDPTAGLANLRLAGDWTLPGQAASLEAAARSGHLAAEALLAGA